MGFAASAAADMLSAGDYAIAYSESLLLYHGTRERHQEVTVEKLREMTENLQQTNEYFALKLASQMFRRFATQALLLEAFKTDPPNVSGVVSVGADPEMILRRIREKVQREHQKLMDAAVERMKRVRLLFEHVTGFSTPKKKRDTVARDCSEFKKLVDFEATALKNRLKNGEKINGFNNETLNLIQEDFWQLREFLDGKYFRQAQDLSREKGHYFLTPPETEELRAIPRAQKEQRLKYLVEKATPRILPLWYLVVALCRLLQQGEHTFSAHDAWWLGLVDEIPGTSLPSIRLWKELRQKAKQKAPAAPLPSAQSPPSISPQRT